MKTESADEIMSELNSKVQAALTFRGLRIHCFDFLRTQKSLKTMNIERVKKQFFPIRPKTAILVFLREYRGKPVLRNVEKLNTIS